MTVPTPTAVSAELRARPSAHGNQIPKILQEPGQVGGHNVPYAVRDRCQFGSPLSSPRSHHARGVAKAALEYHRGSTRSRPPRDILTGLMAHGWSCADPGRPIIDRSRGFSRARA
jgi:hypothetical protein